MIVVVQRVSEASVRTNDTIKSSIKKGMVVLLGIAHEDNSIDIVWICNKIFQLRIFNNSEGTMDINIKEAKGSILVVSQFTLLASTKKGNRPSYAAAANTTIAKGLYEIFLTKLKEVSGVEIQSGEFGADMKVSLVNDGPVTIIINSKEKI